MTFDPRPVTLDDFPSLRRALHESWRRGIALEQLEVERRREAAAVHVGPPRTTPCPDCGVLVETTWTRTGKLCLGCRRARHRAAVNRTAARRIANREVRARGSAGLASGVGTGRRPQRRAPPLRSAFNPFGGLA